jgi:hypothetical protein
MNRFLPHHPAATLKTLFINKTADVLWIVVGEDRAPHGREVKVSLVLAKWG